MFQTRQNQKSNTGGLCELVWGLYNSYNLLQDLIYFLFFNVMNMAERAEQIDYEPDVLKFKQIWEEIKQTKKQKNQKSQSQKENRAKSKNQARTKEPSTMKEKPKKQKKQTIISDKNIQRNPKRNEQKVVQVVTKPQSFYNDSLKNQKNNVETQNLIQTASNHPNLVEVSSLKKSLEQKDLQLSLLRVRNSANQGRIKELQQKISEKEQKISKLQARQRQLISRNGSLLDNQKLFDYGKIQYQNFKNDTRRLLKMLQTTNQYQQFSNLALDDNGVRFLNEANKKFKSSLDSKQRTVLHFCTCNKDFIPQSGFWVPEKVYNYGKQFIKQRKGVMTPAQLQLLLYDLNKIYRERQKRIVNTLNSQKARQVDFLKRKIYLHKSPQQ